MDKATKHILMEKDAEKRDNAGGKSTITSREIPESFGPRSPKISPL